MCMRPAAMTTPDLFPARSLPHGLEYHDDFLTLDEEANLLGEFARLPFREAKFQQYTARRRVVRFGEAYDPDTDDFPNVGALPPWLAAIRAKVAAWRGIPEDHF